MRSCAIQSHAAAVASQADDLLSANAGYPAAEAAVCAAFPKHRTMCALLHCALGIVHAPLHSLNLPAPVRALDRSNVT